MTKYEMFSAIRERVIDNKDMVAFIDHELALLDKRKGSARKPTKNQRENEVLRTQIMDVMDTMSEPICIKELMSVCPAISELSNQRITHLIKPLVDSGKLVRLKIQKIACYAVPALVEELNELQDYDYDEDESDE